MTVDTDHTLYNYSVHIQQYTIQYYDMNAFFEIQ